MNRRGEKPEFLQGDEEELPTKQSVDLLEQENINRFDKSKSKKKKKKNKPQAAQGTPDNKEVKAAAENAKATEQTPGVPANGNNKPSGNRKKKKGGNRGTNGNSPNVPIDKPAQQEGEHKPSGENN